MLVSGHVRHERGVPQEQAGDRLRTGRHHGPRRGTAAFGWPQGQGGQGAVRAGRGPRSSGVLFMCRLPEATVLRRHQRGMNGRSSPTSVADRGQQAGTASRTREWRPAADAASGGSRSMAGSRWPRRGRHVNGRSPRG
jgi:hypothetical protein